MKPEVDCEADPFCPYFPACQEAMRSLPEIRDMWFRHYIHGLILQVWRNDHPGGGCYSEVDQMPGVTDNDSIIQELKDDHGIMSVVLWCPCSCDANTGTGFRIRHVRTAMATARFNMGSMSWSLYDPRRMPGPPVSNHQHLQSQIPPAACQRPPGYCSVRPAPFLPIWIPSSAPSRENRFALMARQEHEIRRGSIDGCADGQY